MYGTTGLTRMITMGRTVRMIPIYVRITVVVLAYDTPCFTYVKDSYDQVKRIRNFFRIDLIQPRSVPEATGYSFTELHPNKYFSEIMKPGRWNVKFQRPHRKVWVTLNVVILICCWRKSEGSWR